jgi:alkylation response protein AidB-like acyl-CoA dehydrogenase
MPLDSLVRVADWPSTQVGRRLRLCLGHSLVGLAERMLGVSLDHVRTRSQFGTPLARQQTVQHRLADVHLEIESARSLLAAAWRSPSRVVAMAAKSQAGAAALLAAQHAQQLCGALGFTAEFGLHRMVRRAYLLDALLGSADVLTSDIGRWLAMGTPSAVMSATEVCVDF